MGCLSPSEVGASAPFPWHPVEIATGLMLGIVDDPKPLPAVEDAATMRSVLEDVIRRAYDRGPVAVSFSGGRDSSVVLAVAQHVAREGGFDAPLPVTLVYPRIESADEASWQTLVLSHLQIKDRVILSIEDELDLLGPVASSALTEHGLLWPPNGFTHGRMLRECRGMTLLTGGGGDELFDDSGASRTQLVLARSVRPTPRDALRIAASLAMRPAYDARRARFLPKLSWLSARGQKRFARQYVRDLGPPYRSWSRRLADQVNARSFAALRRGQDLLASSQGARIEHPFLDPSLIAAAARDGGRLGLGGRTNAMRSIASDLLPDVLLDRSTKASFSQGFWTRESLEFARSGASVEVLADDPGLAGLLDVHELRAEWSKPVPPFLTAGLLQSAFLSRTASSASDRHV